MKKHFFLIFSLVSFWTIQAQFGPKQDIAVDADGTQSIFMVDLDGDSLVDALSANKFSSTISWYKNMDGMGTFGSQITIATLSEPKFVFAADLDGDNDMDVLATAPFVDMLVWYENLDGQGAFSGERIIYDGVSPLGAFDVKTADIDGDSDEDVILASNSDGLMWFENLDGLGNFGAPDIVSDALTDCRSVFVGNFDGDGDLDILANSSGSGNLFWFRNLDGQGNFGSPNEVEPTSTYPNSVLGADLDGDNDLDILTAIPAANTIAWHENVNGFGSFGPEQIISTNANFALSVYAVDTDNDLDIDILSASASDNKIAWYENLNGQGSFSSQNVLTVNAIGAQSVVSADLNNDGDMDVFSASQNDDTLAWYENLTILGVEEFDATMVEIVPNPVDNILSIRSEIAIDEVVVYDVLGKELLRKKGNVNELNVSGLPSGLLFLELITPQGLALEKVVKE